MIRPSYEMDLSQIVRSSILLSGRKLPLQKICTQIFSRGHLYINVLFAVWILGNFKLHLVFLTYGFWIEQVAFWASTFDGFACTDDHGYIVFYDHLPKMVYSMWKRSLTSDYFLISHAFFSFVWRVNVTRINIIEFWVFAFSHSLFQMNSRFIIRKNISVAVSLVINFVHNEFFHDIILLKHLSKCIVLILNKLVSNFWGARLSVEIWNFKRLHQLRILGD